jgi:hypothetical protein
MVNHSKGNLKHFFTPKEQISKKFILLLKLLMYI